jgi:hypothetical protein
VRAAAAIVLAVLAVLVGCSRPQPEATPDGVVRLWLDKMEQSSDDPRAIREAYALLGPAARANLEERAQRASRVLGRRVEPYEMLAEGHFGLRFRPKAMAAQVQGDRATVEVRGSAADERALVTCVKEGATWKVEPELPDVATLPKRGDGGI